MLSQLKLFCFFVFNLNNCLIKTSLNFASIEELIEESDFICCMIKISDVSAKFSIYE